MLLVVQSRLALLDPSQGLLVYILPRSPTTAACWDHPPSQVVRCTLRDHSREAGPGDLPAQDLALA